MICATPSFQFPLEYYLLVAAVLMLVTLYVAVKYCAGKFMSRPEWQAEAMVELQNIITGCGFIAIAFLFLGASNAIACAVTGNVNPVQAASSFLQMIMFKGVLQGINDVFTVQIVYSVLNTFALRPHEAVWTWTFKIFPGADGIVSMCNVIGYGLTAAFGSIAAQLAILSFIDATMYPFFLPAGVLLRFFPPTRDAGTFLIVMAIGFQVIFPMTYVINQMALDGVWSHTGRGPSYVPTISTTEAAYWKYAFVAAPFQVLFVGQAAGAIIKLVGSSIPGLSTIGSAGVTAATMATMEITVYALMMSMFKPVLETLAELSIASLFLPTIAITLTFAFINSVTKFVSAKV